MQIFTLIAPLAFIVSLGYFCAKTQWFDKNQIEALSKFTFNLAIPVFVFYQMANADFNQHLSLKFFTAFYLPVLFCFGLTWLINQYFHPQHKLNKSASAGFALGSSYSNTVIVGLPILIMVYGKQTVPLIFMIVTFHSAMLFALTSVIASSEKGFNWRAFLVSTFNNPLIIGIVSGALFNLSSLTLPNIIAESLLLLGKPAITLALFSLGASLAYYHVKQELAFITIATTVKLLLLPCLVYIVSHHVFSLEAISVKVLVILSACPTGLNAYVLAKSFNAHQQTVASIVVASTFLCLLTIPVWLYFLA